MITTEEKWKFITRRQSFLEDADAESLKQLLEVKPKLKLAWETTPTGKRMWSLKAKEDPLLVLTFSSIAHVGYFVPIAKLLDFVRAGLDVCLPIPIPSPWGEFD